MPKSEKPLLVLVDGSSYLYRAFHGLPPLVNREGMPTGAVYGVLRMLRKLIEESCPDRVGVIFDAKGKTFRHDMYAEYKANRPPMPDDLRVQIEPLYDAIRALGMPMHAIPGVEADDVIGTLAKEGVEAGFQVLISTGDKDMAQLVNADVRLINTMNNSVLRPDSVHEKFGVYAEQIIDYLALMGDKVDNIPGVPGVGPKTAAKWLTQYKTMQGVIENADQIGGKIGEKLRAALPQLPLSYELATIDCAVPLEFVADELQMMTEDKEQLLSLYETLGFNSWLQELQGGQAKTATGASAAATASKSEQAIAGEYELILTLEQLQQWALKLATAELIAFDTETDSLDYMQANLVGMSFAVEAGKAAYLPLAHDYIGAPQQISLEQALQVLQPILEDPTRPKLGHNLKYDKSVLARHGVRLLGIQHDTMLQSYINNSTASRHDLDSLCQLHLNHENIKFTDVAGKGAKQVTFNQVDLAVALDYAAEDADMCLRLHNKLWPRLSANHRAEKLYCELEVPVLSILSAVERNGVFIDKALLQEQSGELAVKLEALQSEAFSAAKTEFNLDSPKQLQSILFEELGLPVIRKTPKGQPSTAEDVLQELAQDYDLPRIIIEYRSLKKLKSTYTDKLPQQIDADSQRIHTSYHQAVAATGRLSSSDPNLQNIPIRSEEGRRIRQAFIATPGHTLLAADYSQIELRIMAHLSKDERLCAAFAAGEDIHNATAAEVFGVPTDDVSIDQRRSAKAINFGLIYGMSAFGLAKQLGISRSEAAEYVNLYFERYPGVKAYMESTRLRAHELGYVETLFGRRLYLPEIESRNAQRRQYAERTAINAPMQGTAADIIKHAMLSVNQWLEASSYDVRMIMQVHDELVFELPIAQLDEVKPEIIRLMCAAADLSVPLEVDANSGDNWDQAH